ncbi:MAG: DNA helicase UvrD, partial [Spirochaetales bacterium]
MRLSRCLPLQIRGEVSVKLDADQTKAIQISHNAVVSAGAGSGKTSVLTRRYLRLVAEEHVPVHRILALTFTRKAAAEMYTRVYQTLADHVRDAGEAPDSFVTEQLGGFDRAAISTLDSFCAGVARNGCTQFGVPPTFSVDEVRLRDLTERLALGFLLENADDPALSAAIRLNRFGPMWRGGLARLAADHFLVSGGGSLSGYGAKQQKVLEKNLRKGAEELHRSIIALLDLDPSAAKCIATAQGVIGNLDLDDLLGGDLVEHLLVRSAQTDGSDDDAGGVLSARVAAAVDATTAASKVKLTCGNSNHPDVQLLKELVGELRVAVSVLGEALHTALMWPTLYRLNEKLDGFRDQVIAEKRRSGLLSYQDVTALAISVLSDNLSLRRHYKSRFSSVMIDEFQDNNEEQKALLYLLAEEPGSELPGVPTPDRLDPSKLFFVGDEKQSIYRFRGAAVSVFRALSVELAPGASVRLGHNYRSEPGLILFFNELFGQVFRDAVAPYEARFEALQWRDPTPGVIPRVEYWKVGRRAELDDTGDYIDDGDSEAYHIARFIRDAVTGGTLPLDEARSAGYGDFAILMRSTGNQIRIERMLRLFGV